MKLFRSIIAGFGLLAAACDEIPTSTEIGLPHTTAGAVFNAAAQMGPILVEIVGQPFSDGRKLDPDALAAMVQGSFTYPWLKFTGDRSKAAQTDVRLIWVIDPSDTLTGDAACQGQASSAATRRANRVDLRVFLCAEKRPLHAVRGHVRRPSDPNDGWWRQLIVQMSRQLIGIN